VAYSAACSSSVIG